MSDPRPVLLEATAISKSYFKLGHEIPVLRNANLTMREGDMCSVRGKSGVGKSTLLHVLGTLDRPTTGTVRFGEGATARDVFALPEGELAAFRNRTMGFVFQFHHLLPELSALENAALPALIGRKPRHEALRAAQALLDEVGLGHRVHHRPGELSGGEQQRVAVARALVTNPRLVLADEPTGNLDQRTSDEIHELIVKLNRDRGVAFLVVTHNNGLAELLPRRLEMRDGVVYEGAP